MNKRGWLKTLEAVIAILLILLVIYSFIPKAPKKTDLEDQLQSSKEAIAEGIMYNEELRKEIIDYPEEPEDCSFSDELKELIDSHLPTGFGYNCRLCTETNCVIVNVPSNKDVYVTDVFISSTMERQDIKIVRIAFWQEAKKEKIKGNRK